MTRQTNWGFNRMYTRVLGTLIRAPEKRVQSGGGAGALRGPGRPRVPKIADGWEWMRISQPHTAASSGRPAETAHFWDRQSRCRAPPDAAGQSEFEDQCVVAEQARAILGACLATKQLLRSMHFTRTLSLVCNNRAVLRPWHRHGLEDSSGRCSYAEEYGFDHRLRLWWLTSLPTS